MAELRHYTVEFDYDGPVLTRGAMQAWLDYWLHENGHYPERLSLGVSGATRRVDRNWSEAPDAVEGETPDKG